MNRKIFISLLLIGVLAFGAGLGTFAWFTSTATSANNIFETGTLVIKPLDDNVFASGITSINNIYPGWSGSKTVTITNTGSLNFMYRLENIELTGSNDTAGILYNGADGLLVSFDNTNYVLAKNLSNYNFPELAANSTKDATQTITVYFKLPESANNDYQGKTATLKFNFFATQTTNTSWVH